MSKKRKSPRKTRTRTKEKQQYSKRNARNGSTFEIENILLLLFSQKQQELAINQIFTEETLQLFSRKEILNGLTALEAEEFIVKIGRKQFKLHPKTALYRGTYCGNPKGFGFVGGTGVGKKTAPLTKDAFISPSNTGSAYHGDTVLIRLQKSKKPHKTEGIVIKVLQRGKDNLCGIIAHRGIETIVYPDDPRYPFQIRVDNEEEHIFQDGDAVSVEFERVGIPQKILHGKILSVLGSPDNIDTQMQLIINSFKLPNQFPAAVLNQAESFPSTLQLQGRTDLRNTQHITIDGETAKDFDDAICIEKTRKGFRLYVSIADVSHFVTPDSAIDTEAATRGTSIYFPDRVIPMLPEKISNELCSLVPGEERYTVTAFLEFDREGNLKKKKFGRSIINSHHRFTYDTVSQILVDKNPQIRREHKPFLTMLRWSEELATALLDKRRKRGAIEFDLTEPFFILDESGRIKDIKKTGRNFSHQIIEEFMLAANEAVAAHFTEQRVYSLFRVHETPKSERIKEVADFLGKLGFSSKLMEDADKSKWFCEALAFFKDSKYEYLVNNLLLRSMNQAHYSPKNNGHFGLATMSYTHFTSPIRRYPDLLVHRHLLGSTTAAAGNSQEPQGLTALYQAGELLSARERVAVNAERDMHARLQISYAKDRIGNDYEAIISGVNEKGLYIEIPEHCLHGTIPIRDLGSDYFLFDSKNHRLFGEITAKTFQIGDTLRVRLHYVDQYRRKIIFQPIKDNQER